MKTNILEVSMGALVLIVCAAFGFFVYTKSQWRSSPGYEITAKFDRIDGLVRGTDVRLSGVKVGHVKHISLDPKTYLAVVHMSLDPDVKLPQDSSAEIVSDGLLGGKIMALIPGGDENFIPYGGEIKFTQAAISLESLIGQFIFNAQDKKEDPVVEKASTTLSK